MNPAWLFFIGTLLFWAGAVLVMVGLAKALRLAFRVPGLDGGTLQKSALVNTGLGAAMLLISRFLPMPLGRPEPEGLTLPLVWLLMPWTMWIAVGAVAIALASMMWGWLAVGAAERKQSFITSAICLGLAALFFFFFKNSDSNIDIFRGRLPISISTILVVVGLIVAALATVSALSRTAALRGLGTKLACHLALLAGSVVFGLPFVWLLLTSLKEDKDILSSDGIKWQAYVTEKVPYRDPEEPLFKARFKGRDVEAVLLEKSPTGEMMLDISRPMILRGTTFTTREATEIDKMVPKVKGTFEGTAMTGIAIKELEGGTRRVLIQTPETLKGKTVEILSKDAEDVRSPGYNWSNYPDALNFLPADTNMGLTYLKNTMILVILSVIGTVVSCTMVAYAFARLKFFGKNFLFAMLLSTMMLPAAVTMLPQFLIFRGLGWIDTLLPLWVPAFFAGAFNVFLLRQFFSTIPMELEDAAKIDGCSYPRTLSQILVPQIKPALAAISIFTAMGAWNNFMGPLIYINSPDKMPISYALQLYSSQRGGEYALVAAATTMSIIPVILLFFFAQKYFIEGVTLSGLGGR